MCQDGNCWGLVLMAAVVALPAVLIYSKVVWRSVNLTLKAGDKVNSSVVLRTNIPDRDIRLDYERGEQGLFKLTVTCWGKIAFFAYPYGNSGLTLEVGNNVDMIDGDIGGRVSATRNVNWPRIWIKLSQPVFGDRLRVEFSTDSQPD